jgi:signal transduction histidine kinase
MPKRALNLLSSRDWPYWLNVTIIVAVYMLAARFGFTLAVVAKQVTVVWPPTGIALAALLLFGQRLWPAIALSAFLVNQQADEPWLTACAIAAGNTLEALMAAWLLRRVAAFESPLERLRDVFALIGFGALLSTTVSATIGVTSLCLGQVVSWSSFGSVWLVWWMGDALGDLIVAPLLLTWAAKPRLYRQAWRIGEAVAFFSVLVITSVIFFASRLPVASQNYQLKYVAFPFTMWAALRFGQRAAITAVFVVLATTLWGVTHALGPFAAGTLHERLLLSQAFMGVLAMTALAMGAVTTERKRGGEALRESEVTLQRQGEELRALAADLITAQDKERRRLARELHDDLNQKLASLAIEIQGLQRNLPSSPLLMLEQLQGLRNRVLKLSEEVGHLAYQLHPSILDDLGLVVAMEYYIEEFSRREGIRVGFSQRNLPESFPQEIACCLYRIAQESLHNVSQHACATQVAVKLARYDHSIHLSIKDWGLGFKQDLLSRQQRGLGLLSMQERLRLVNGSFSVRSRPGCGTKVIARIPWPGRTA